jgi:hypothetical protein
MTSCTLFVNNKYQKLREEMGRELDELISDIKEMRSKSTSPESFKKRVAQYLKDTSEEKLLNERELVRQVAKRDFNLKRIESFEGNAPEGLASLLRATNYNKKNGGLSVEAVMGSFNKKYQTILEQSLSEAEMKILASRSIDSDIIKYLSSGGKEDVPALVKKVGDIFKKYQDKIFADKKETGIDLNYRENYAVNQKDIYNVKKMNEIGRDTWVSMVYEALDKEKTFPLMADEADRLKYLEDVFDGFAQRELDKEAVDFENIPKDMIKPSIQRKNLKPRTMHFSPEGLAKMWETFSEKSVLESMVADGARAARDIGVYEVLGPNGQNEFNTLKQKVIRNLQAQIKDAKSDSAKAKLQAQIDKIEGNSKASFFNFEGSYDALWANINGTVDHEGSKAWATVGENLRALTSMQVLGGSMFSALTDIFGGVSALNMATGNGYFNSMMDVGMGLLKTYSPSEQKRLAGMLNISLESAMGNILRVAGSEDGVTKGINKLNYWYTKVNPIAQQGRFHRVAATTMYSLELGQQVKKSWADIGEFHQKSLMKAGITENDWDAFKLLQVEIKDGQNGISTVAINNISDEAATSAIAKNKASNPQFLPKTPKEYKAYLSKRVDVLYDEFANFAAPNPGLRERAFLHGTTQKGTAGGEFIRTIAMLKSFTVKQASIMQKIYYNSPTKAGKAQHLAAHTLGLMSMGYVAMSLKAIANNETPPDPTNPKTIQKAFLLSGAAGPMGEMLLGEAERGKFLQGFIGGPVVSKADTLVDLSKKFASGGGKLKALGTLSEFVPGNNLHFVKAGMNYTILDSWKELTSEGHRSRMEQRRKEASGILWSQEKIIE